MICYHGSHLKGLKKLTYSEGNSRFGGEDKLLHGAAIYLTTSKMEAVAYATSGSYYKVKITKEVFDATSLNDMKDFVLRFQKEIDLEVNLLKNQLIKELFNVVMLGKASGVIFHEHLFKTISNDQDLYESVIGEKFNYDYDLCLAKLKDMFQFSFIKINHRDSIWVLCLDFSGDGIEIIEEVDISQ